MSTKKLQILGSLGGTSVQPDWNQNDETSADYIKNRPFYEGDVQETLIADIVAEMNSAGEGWQDMGDGLLVGVAPNGGVRRIVENEEYTVVINGVQYQSVAQNDTVLNDPGTTCVLGDYDALISGDKASFRYSVFDNVEGTGVYYIGETPPSEFKIISVVEDVHKIDPKYLPEGVGYTELVDAGIPEQTVEGFAVMQGPIYAVQNPFPFSLIEGADYTVTWDGVEYNVKCEYDGFIKYCGNINYLSLQSGGDIPFVIAESGGTLIIATESSSPSHTIKIETTIENIHKIDSKYLDYKSIIDVIELPTDGIDPNTFYRVISVDSRAYVEQDVPMDSATAVAVDILPPVGETGVLYYEVKTGIPWFDVDGTGQWLDARSQGISVISSFDGYEPTGNPVILVQSNLFHYNNGWVEVGSGSNGDSDTVVVSIDLDNMTASMTGNQIFKAINNGKRVILYDGTPIYIIWDNGNDAIAYFSASYPIITDVTSSEFIEKTSEVGLMYIKPDGSVMRGNAYGNYPLPAEEDANKILVAVGDFYGSTQWVDPSILQGDGSSSQIQADWNQTDDTALDYIKNKPEIPEAQIQSDWNQTDDTALDYIKNKPEIPTDVLSYSAQTLTDEQKAQARANIGAATVEEVIADLPEIPEVPTALKNPYALTFSGLVENSYDGSESINIEIPSGLPEVSEENNGQVLQVVDGVWQPSTPTAVNYTTYIDQSNGYEYYVYIYEGKMVIKSQLTGIAIITTPTYTLGDGVSDLIVTANYPDGKTVEISNYTYSVNTTSETPTITVYYTEFGKTYSTTCNLIVDDSKFIDFTYTINDDNSVTLDTWKGTLNGETSTECVIPEGNNIII